MAIPDDSEEEKAKATIEKARHISIRVTEKDLRKIKAKAVATNISLPGP